MFGRTWGYGGYYPRGYLGAGIGFPYGGLIGYPFLGYGYPVCGYGYGCYRTPYLPYY